MLVMLRCIAERITAGMRNPTKAPRKQAESERT
jgi:hypothetical protein